MHQLQVPYYRQLTPYTCAVACMRMTLKYHNVPTTRRKLIKELRPDPVTGTENQRLLDALDSYGLQYDAGPMQWDDVKKALARNMPVIVNYKSFVDDDGHFAVVTGRTKAHVLLHDPWLKPLTPHPIAAFKKAWYGHGTDNPDAGWGIIVHTKIEDR